MQKMSKLFKTVGKTFTKNSPTILTAFACGGVISTAVMAVRATPKALSVIEDECHERKEENLPVKDMVLLTWRYYAPSMAMGALTIGCVVAANSISTRRNATLSALYALSEKALREYQGKVVEVIGENKERVIRDEIARDRILRQPVEEGPIVITAHGETLCYDSMSGRYFKSDIEKIRQTQNNLNAQMLAGEDYISLNDLYYCLGLKGTKMGEEVGWRAEDGLLDLCFSSQLTENGHPCLVLDYKVAPRYEYDC